MLWITNRAELKMLVIKNWKQNQNKKISIIHKLCPQLSTNHLYNFSYNSTVVSFFSHYGLSLLYVLLSTFCTSLHLWTLLFCIYYYYCCCTVCIALLFSYSAMFIAASVRNKLIHSFIHSTFGFQHTRITFTSFTTDTEKTSKPVCAHTLIHGCLSAWAAVIRLAGLTVNILLMRFLASVVTVSHSGDGYYNTPHYYYTYYHYNTTTTPGAAAAAATTATTTTTTTTTTSMA